MTTASQTPPPAAQHPWDAADTDPWWKTQANGTEIHYHVRSGRFIRGTVTRRRGVPELLATALVGTWDPQSILLSVEDDGTPRYDHHARLILNGGSWTPSPSRIYEYDTSGFAPGSDPRTMEPVAIPRPEITPEQAETRRYDQILQEVHDVLKDRGTPSKDRLATVKAMLDHI